MARSMDTPLKNAQETIKKYSKGSCREPLVKAFFDNETFTVSYVIKDPASRKALIIDSVLDFDVASGHFSTLSANRIIDYVSEHNLDILWHLETHVHADHISAAPFLKSKLGGKIGIGENITKVQNLFGDVFNEKENFARNGSQFDQLFSDGDKFSLGELDCVVLHVPGHTPADLAFIIGNVAFVGDTLFMPDYGTARADFPGGNARALFRSIRRILKLPKQTRLFMCHDYKAPGRETFCWESTVEEQRISNIHVHDGVNEAEFVKMREARDNSLGMPTLIIPSVQVNMRAGNMPKPEDNGISYLKIPVGVL